MSDGKSADLSSSYFLSRRDFLRWTSALSLSMLAFFPRRKAEQLQGFEQSPRPWDHRYMVYEVHTRPTGPELIPTDTDILIKEYSSDYLHSSRGLINLFRSHNSDGSSVFGEGVIKRLGDIGAKVGFTDVTLFPEGGREIQQNIIGAEGLIGGAAAGALAVMKAQDVIRERQEEGNQVDIFRSVKRGLLKLGLFATVFWGLGYFVGATGVATMLADGRGTTDPIKLKMIELFGAYNDTLHPEHLLLGLRNAVNAIKIIDTCQKMEITLGRKPNVAIVFGAAHGGLKTLLDAGPEACLEFLDLFPDGILQMMCDAQKGPANVATSLIATPPPGFDPDKYTSTENIDQINLYPTSYLCDSLLAFLKGRGMVDPVSSEVPSDRIST